MRKRCLILVLALSVLSCLIVECKKEEEPGAIFGMVTDFSSGEPVSSANVQLQPSGETTLTGTDGMYEFPEVPKGSYSITVSKAEYTDLIDDYVINVTEGKRVRRDVQIEKRPLALHLYDNESHEISELDFGSDEGITKKTFNIFNKGSQRIDFKIEKSVNWITDISPANGSIDVGVTKPIVVTIDRRLLAVGDNTTTILITSLSGGGRELTVKASNNVETPTVSIVEINPIDSVTYRIRCEVETEGYQTVTERGICWNTFGTPTMDDETIPYSSGGLGQYTIRMENLSIGTRYYVRAYAKNSVGTGLSETVNFVAGEIVTIPEVSTVEVKEVTATSAVCKGNVTYDGGTELLERGVCWDTYANPTISEQHQAASGTVTGTFNVSITGLSSNTTYHVRAYAKNNKGTAYGNELTFTTTAGLPAVTTAGVTNITANSATGGGTVTDQGNSNVTERGICWSTSHNPTLVSNHANSGAGSGSFTVNMTELTPNETYYVRAYAKNLQGIAYGSEVSFRVLEGLPQVTTANVTNITTTSAKGGGNVTDQGESTVTERGICWSTTPNPTLSVTNAHSGTGVGSFTVDMTGLTPGTKYYVCAYAINAQGTNYGDQKEFTTGVNQPTVTTTNITDITSTTAIGRGEVTDDGGAAVTERGICWSTNHNPSIAGSHVSNGTGIGSFSVEITGLTPNTTYYAKAYAKNSAGTSYGDEVSFSTDMLTIYTIGVSADPIEGGMVSGGGNYQQGQSCTVKATPATGYTFLNWTENGSQVSTNANYNFTVDRERSLVAHFQLQSYTISVLADPSNGGTVTGGGSINYGESCTVTAFPNAGYTFLRWTENGSQVSTNASYSFTVTSNRNLVAQFQAMNYTISTSSNPPDQGITSGSGSYQYGSQCIVTAIPNTGYSLIDWTENGTSVSSSANYTFTVTGDRDLVANFAPQTYIISVSASPSYGGGVTGGGSYSFGQTCTVTATAASNYLFLYWTENEEIVSSEESYSFTVSGYRTLMAHFAIPPMGALAGLFTINHEKEKVFFSQGNLQYIGESDIWKFADNQWDIVGINQGGTSESITRDLFGWGTSGYNHGANCYQPWSTSSDDNDYLAYGMSGYNLYDQSGKADWGYNAISNGGNMENCGWRTLTTSEWGYVFNSRTTASGIRYAKARVCNMCGVILLPDNWDSNNYNLQNANTPNCDFTANIIDNSTWMTSFAPYGCVFLPTASYRDGTAYVLYNNYYVGYYWSSSYNNNGYAFIMDFNPEQVSATGWSWHTNLGLSVRLVRDAQ